MSDVAADGLSALCALCCICCTGALENWLFFTKCGMGSSTSDAACCNSCCKRSFDEDDFEREARQARERERAAAGAEARDGSGNQGVDDKLGPKKSGEGESAVVDAQPAPVMAMEQPRRSSEGTVQ